MIIIFFKKLGFTPYKTGQALQSMEVQGVKRCQLILDLKPPRL